MVDVKISAAPLRNKMKKRFSDEHQLVPVLLNASVIRQLLAECFLDLVGFEHQMTIYRLLQIILNYPIKRILCIYFIIPLK